MCKKLHICMGLPGSGKTHLLRSLLKDFEIIEVDYMDKQEEVKYTIKTKLDYLMEIHNFSIVAAIGIDTLIINNEQLTNLLDFLTTIPNIQEYEIIIHWFKPDRDACLYNDQGRRPMECDFMIRRAKVEEIDIDELTKRYVETKKFSKISVDKREVKRKPIYKRKPEFEKRIEQKYTLFDKEIVESESWLVDGEWNNNWNNNNTRCKDLFESPKDFNLLNKLLNDIAPNITDEHVAEVKKLIKKDSYATYAYYNSWYEYEFWYVNLDELLTLLGELGYIEDVDD